MKSIEWLKALLTLTDDIRGLKDKIAANNNSSETALDKIMDRLIKIETKMAILEQTIDMKIQVAETNACKAAAVAVSSSILTIMSSPATHRPAHSPTEVHPSPPEFRKRKNARKLNPPEQMIE
jgi:hypothetical protein